MEELLANAGEGVRELFGRIETVLLILGLFSLTTCWFLLRRYPPDMAAKNARLAGRALGALEIFGIVQAYLLLILLSMFSGRFFYEEQIPTAKLAITLGIYCIVTLIILFNNRRGKRSLADGFGLGLRQLKYIVAAPWFYLALVPILISIGYALKLVGYDLPLQDNAQQFVESGPAERILFALAAIFGAPVFEEIMFRGIVFPAVLKRAGLKAAVLLTSCLFAMMHFNFLMFLLMFTPLIIVAALFWPSRQRALRVLARAALAGTAAVAVWFTLVSGSFHSFLSLMTLSTGVCLAYWYTGSLWTSIVMHALFNAVTLYTLNLAG